MNIISSIPVLGWLLISSLFFAAGEFLSKKFALNPSVPLVIFLVVVDVLSILSWLPAIMKQHELSIVGTLWSVLSLITTVCIGVFFFGETLSTTTVLGIAFGFVAVILLSL